MMFGITFWQVVQAFLPLIRQATGRIVFMSSVAGKISGNFQGPYAASKHALEVHMRKQLQKCLLFCLFNDLVIHYLLNMRAVHFVFFHLYKLINLTSFRQLQTHCAASYLLGTSVCQSSTLGKFPRHYWALTIKKQPGRRQNWAKLVTRWMPFVLNASKFEYHSVTNNSDSILNRMKLLFLESLIHTDTSISFF